ncbi:MAG: hypothetical protein ACI9MR_000002 [Myxococcota bacterium]|jgi:hypothetical protein
MTDSNKQCPQRIGYSHPVCPAGRPCKRTKDERRTDRAWMAQARVRMAQDEAEAPVQGGHIQHAWLEAAALSHIPSRLAIRRHPNPRVHGLRYNHDKSLVEVRFSGLKLPREWELFIVARFANRDEYMLRVLADPAWSTVAKTTEVVDGVEDNRTRTDAEVATEWMARRNNLVDYQRAQLEALPVEEQPPIEEWPVRE